MIEMRWLKYKSNMNPDTGEYFSTPCSFARLQYREVIHFVDSLGEIHISAEIDWIDVPTVEED